MHRRLLWAMFASGLLWMSAGFNLAFAAMSLDEANKVIEVCNEEEDVVDASKVDAAMAVYKAKAEKGDVATQLKLGNIYYNGLCTSDEGGKQAIMWYTKAANAGNVDAKSSLGSLYYGLEDYTNAILWYKKAAANNDKNAQYYLGILYSKDSAKDEQLANEWFSAYVAEDPSLLTNIGRLFAEGYDVPQDYNKALAWYLKAEQKGQNEARYQIADALCLNGQSGTDVTIMQKLRSMV